MGREPWKGKEMGANVCRISLDLFQTCYNSLLTLRQTYVLIKRKLNLKLYNRGIVIKSRLSSTVDWSMKSKIELKVDIPSTD
jgi:hypothetical protein